MLPRCALLLALLAHLPAAALAGGAAACSAPVCRVDPAELALAERVDFDDHPSGWDPGIRIDTILSFPGASFAERFAGQTAVPQGDFDRLTGSPLAPLALLPGARGQNLSVVRLHGSNILTGFGPASWPKVAAQGEGAISVLFDEDQPALALDILGGERGPLRIAFWSRSGTLLHTERLTTTHPLTLGFARRGGAADIAGLSITNTDPQGLAIDNLRFGPAPEMG